MSSAFSAKISPNVIHSFEANRQIRMQSKEILPFHYNHSKKTDDGDDILWPLGVPKYNVIKPFLILYAINCLLVAKTIISNN